MRNALIVCFAMVVVGSPAFANEAELNAKIQALEAKIARLEQLVEKTTTAPAPVAAAAPVVTLAPAAGPASISGIKISMKPDPVIESTDGNFTFSPHGRLQADAGFFNDDQADHSDGTNVRRLYLGFDGTMFHDWTYRLHANFANNESKIVDAYVAYTGLANTTLTVGQFLEPFSIEEQTNDLHMTFIERASLNSFSFSRNIGAAAARYGANWSLTAGVFGDDTGVASTDDESYSVTGRATYAPLYAPGEVLHLGTAASYRSPDQATNSFRYRAKAENGIANLYSVDTSAALDDVDHALHYGLELAGVWKNFSLQGEYALVDVSRNASENAQFDSWYAYASWFLTGESRNYVANKGIFDRLTPRTPFSLHEGGGLGAWEVAARASNIDLNDGAIQAGGMTNYTLALNWYPTAYTRLMANYIIVDTDESAIAANDDPQLFLMRMQFDF